VRQLKGSAREREGRYGGFLTITVGREVANELPLPLLTVTVTPQRVPNVSRHRVIDRSRGTGSENAVGAVHVTT